MSLMREKSTANDISTNGGKIEGVWLFMRHGDRTPGRSLCAPQFEEQEKAYWRTKLPTPDPVASFYKFSELYPPDIHPSNGGEFVDVSRVPFGFLTTLGVQQQQTNGKRLHARYDHYGHHCEPTDRERRGNDFLNSWHITAYSTNYFRTILSVQGMLDGLLGTDCYDPLKDSVRGTFEVPNHEKIWKNVDIARGDVRVRIRGKADDTLNAFDRERDLTMTLVSHVVESADFIEKDATAAPLAARLANFLPGLARKGRKVFGGPSGINWIEASDHFVCRDVHRLKFSKFSVFEHDDRAEHTMSAMAHQTTTHLAWRFRQWYQYPPLLSKIAAPPLREVLDQMVKTPALQEQDKHPFVIYSCHDVTLLGLLYGLGADFLADEEGGEWRFWPSYASTLVLELVRIEETDSEDSHVVRVLLNGKPIIAANLLEYDQTDELEYVGKGPMQMMRMSDFEKVIERLEHAGQ